MSWDEISALATDLWGLWLLLVFVALVAWTFWPGRKREMDEHAEIPFREEEGRKRRKED